ncbi:MAG: PIN domain-containing protein [Ferruginibacter sp.]
MRVVVDTNIVFSAILNTNSKITRIILQPKSKLNFYSTIQLQDELTEHWNKLKKISCYNDIDLHKSVTLFSSRIKFINVELIPANLLLKTEIFTTSVDLDDTKFVALTEHICGEIKN